MGQNSADMQALLPGEDMNEFAAIKQEKEVFIGDTQLQQMQLRDWCQLDTDKKDADIYRQNSDDKISYYTVLNDIGKTKCLLCGRLLSGNRKANIKRHFKLVHKLDIRVGRERRSSDEEFADQSSLNDTQKEPAKDNVNHDFQMEVKLVNELIVPDTYQNLKQECLQSVDEKQDKEHNQSDDRTTTRVKYSYYKSFFIIQKDVNKTECLECGKLLSGTGKSNILRHYRLVHKKIIDNGREASSSSDEDYEPPSKRTKTIHSFGITIDEIKFLKCCVGLVVVRNLPPRIFDDREFFKTLIAPYEKKFGTDFNSTNIISMLDTSIAKIHNRITNRVKDKMISLKLDIATRMGKGILGINIQYLKDFKVCYNTLGILHLAKVPQETILKEEILKCLDKYEINTCQLYSITIDSGANVVKASEIIQEYHDEYIFDNLDYTKEHVFDNFDNIEGRTFEETIHNSLGSAMQAISCAAHMIQLAACDVLKILEQELVHCREVVKKLGKSASPSEVEKQMPTLDNATSWYATYEMLKSLLNMKEYVCTTYLTNWDFVRDFVAAFCPLAKCTEQLQTDQYIAGDFYRDWFSCELELEDLFSTTPYSKLLHEAMQNKRKLLFENVAFTAALYLDPRFNFINSVMLSEEQKNRAVEHLVKTFEMIQNLENSQPQCEQSESMPETPNVNVDLVPETTPCESSYAKMAKHIASLVAMTTKSSGIQRTIKQKLISLSNCKMVPIHTDILQYFRYTMVDQDISRIIDAVLAVPVNQVSVERTYKALAVTLTKPNSQLTNISLNNILLTKLNFREINSKHFQLEYPDT